MTERDQAPPNPFFISLTEHLGDDDTKLEVRGTAVYTPPRLDEEEGNSGKRQTGAKNGQKKKKNTRYFMIAVCLVKPVTLDQLRDWIVQNARQVVYYTI